VQRQQVKAWLSAGGARKQDTLALDLEDVDGEGWANLKTILLAWHEGKKKNIQVTVDIKFVQKTASRSVQDDFTDSNDLESLEEEVVFSQKKRVSQLLSVECLY